VISGASRRGSREGALETNPDEFLCPKPSDMRYQWLVVRLEAVDEDELTELVFHARRMVVPKKLASLTDDSKKCPSEPSGARPDEPPLSELAHHCPRL
jgi:hypothetical protein